MRKNKEIKVRMTEDEFYQLKLKVDKTPLSRESFVRELLNGCKVMERPPAEYGDILRELRRIGSNVNQLLVVARTRGFVDELKLKRIQADIRSMDETFRTAFIGEK